MAKSRQLERATARQPGRADAAVLFRLNHHCHLPGAEGMAGETIVVPADVAALLVERNGGDRVGPVDGPAAPPAVSEVHEEESAEVAGETA